MNLDADIVVIVRRTNHFPHELGLLLGYPLDDVEGFIKNDGKNCLYTGYWKVYANVPAKRNLFRRFECAREELMKQIRQREKGGTGNCVQTLMQQF